MLYGLGLLTLAAIFFAMATSRAWASGDRSKWVAGWPLGPMLRRMPLAAGRAFLLFWGALMMFLAVVAFIES